MLSDGYWKSRFGGDRSVLGRRIMVDGDAREVIGVLPPSFQFMDRKVSLLMPLRFNRSEVHLGNFSYQGVAAAQARRDAGSRPTPMSRACSPWRLRNFRRPPDSARRCSRTRASVPICGCLKDDLVGDIGNTLWVLMGTVGMVLLIACANVANLLLVRADGRQQELAIRAALGAGWGRIARELLLESALLGLAGGALGLALAYGALRLLAASRPGASAAHRQYLDRPVGAGVHACAFRWRRDCSSA